MNGSSSGVSKGKQMSIEQLEHYMTEKQAEIELERLAEQGYIDSLLSELDDDNAKYTIENIRFIARDTTGQIIWLEKGNSEAGLDHILIRHATDFENKLGVDKKYIAIVLYDIVSTGQVVSNKIKRRNGRDNFERIYKYQDSYYILAGIGSNGFLVSAYPVKLKGEK